MISVSPPGRFVQWTVEGVEPSFAGCKPAVFPLDDTPIPRSSGPGGDRTLNLDFKRVLLCQLSYKASQCVGQESNLHSDAGGLQPLGLANAQPTRRSECPAGVEPACPVWKTDAWAARPRALVSAEGEGVEPSRAFGLAPFRAGCHRRLACPSG